MGSVLSAGVGAALGGIPGAAIGAISGEGGIPNALGIQNNFQAGNPYGPQYLQQQVNNQGQIYGEQQSLGQALQAQMNGLGPNPAQTQFQGNQQANIANAQGLIASQRGLNPALAARMGANVAAQQNQQSALGSALLQQQQQLGATQNYGALLGQEQQGNLGYQGLNLQGSLGTQGINQNTASQNTQNNTKLIGGVLSGVSSAGAAAAGAAHGAYVGGKAKVAGDSPKNDTVPAMLSPGEIVVPRSMAHSPESAKAFVEALFKNKPKESGYGEVIKARNIKKKTNEMKMSDGGFMTVTDTGNEEDLGPTLKRFAQKTIGDTAPPDGHDEIQQSLDPMDVLPPDQMAGAAIMTGKGLAAHLAAAKGSSMLGPAAMGAVRMASNGNLLGTVSRDIMEGGANAIRGDIAKQAVESGVIPTGMKDAEAAAAGNPKLWPSKDNPEEMSGSSSFYNDLKSRLEARFGDKQPKGGVINKNSISKDGDSLIVDTYGRGDTHNAPTTVGGHPRKFIKDWNNPQPFPSDYNKIQDAIANHDGPIVLGSKSDPMMWMDSKYGMTKNTLKNMEGKDLTINTRSDLVAHDDYIDSLRKNKSTVNMIMPPTSDEELARLLEPGAPSVRRRLIAAKRLQDNGIKVNLISAPYDASKELMKKGFGDGYTVSPQFELQRMKNTLKKMGSLDND